MRYRAVLFDLDGTLLDTLEDLGDSANFALRTLGFPEQPLEAFKYFVGDGVENLARQALPEDGQDEATRNRCVALIRSEYGRRWAAKTRPYPGIPELLDRIAAAGLPSAVLSNKPDEFTRLCVTQLLPRWKFDVILGSQPGLPRKPDPTGALRVAEAMRLRPQEFLYLGDTNTDMRTAVAAEMFPAGALWGFRTAEELNESGARVLLKTPLDLLAVLGCRD